MKKKTVPTFDELMNPTLQALKRLDLGSRTACTASRR
jgi:hypothetical protein